LHLIARLILEKALRSVVRKPDDLNDPSWMLIDFKVFVPDEAAWEVFLNKLSLTITSESNLEPVDNDSLLYSLSKAYLNPDLDAQYLISVLIAFIKPTSAATQLINAAYVVSRPPDGFHLQFQQHPPVSINNVMLRDLFAIGLPPPLPAPEKDGRMHAPPVGQPPEEAAAEMQAMRDRLRSESTWFTRIQIFFATDRAPGGEISGANRLQGEKLRFGVCEVSIPKSHKLGVMESPSFMRLEFRPNPNRHIKLQCTWNYSESTFFEELAASVKKSSAKDAFIFVHGYNVSFEDAARRTAQIAFDLNFIGAPIFYSWPSNGKIADYLKDETNVAWSAPHFQEFLTLLCERSGAERIHVIAHSMGNRLVCDAVKALSYNPAGSLKLNHLVLAAPDIDADTFRELAATLNKVSGRITLYESSRDKALMASKKLHGNPRAGEPFLIMPGVDAIDASAIDTNFLGHSYFSDNWPLLSDIHSLLFKDDPPLARFGLSEMQHADGVYYAFKA
jgi:esterase/lipase superfamily enzyme